MPPVWRLAHKILGQARTEGEAHHLQSTPTARHSRASRPAAKPVNKTVEAATDSHIWLIESSGEALGFSRFESTADGFRALR